MINKVGGTKLTHMLDNLRLRFSAKLKTDSNSNGYKLLKLFQQFDVLATGVLEIHHFVHALQTFGVQLPEEAEVALFSRFDMHTDGHLDYKEFIAAVLDPEYLLLGFSSLHPKDSLDMSKSLENKNKVESMDYQLSHRFKQLASQTAGYLLKDIFRKVDEGKNGRISRTAFVACLQKYTIRLTEKELQFLYSKFDKDGKGLVYNDFVAEYFPSIFESSLGKSMHSGNSLRSFKHYNR